MTFKLVRERCPLLDRRSKGPWPRFYRSDPVFVALAPFLFMRGEARKGASPVFV